MSGRVLASFVSGSTFEATVEAAVEALAAAAELGRLLDRLLRPLAGRLRACETFNCSSSLSARACMLFTSDSADRSSCFAGVAAPVGALSASSASSGAASAAADIKASAGLRFITTMCLLLTFRARARGRDLLLPAFCASALAVSSPGSSPSGSYLGCSRRRTERLQHTIALDRGRQVRTLPWLGAGPNRSDARTCDAVSFSTRGFLPRGQGFMAS
mmetsp:Transcript_61433/g.143860  ORF Transcript_61433/g.143860 Transcript_61433/m.143860 type:complete len:216 (+) Transcript_61433:371-1018(+)